jgi:trigger factor
MVGIRLLAASKEAHLGVMATAPVKMEWKTEPGSRAILNIEIPEDDVNRAMDRAYATLVQRVTVPGFRRGKAPRTVLERHVGAEALKEQAFKDLLPERYAQAVAQAGVTPVSRPSFEVKEDPDGKGLRMTATVEIYPQVTLPDYRSLRVPRDHRPPTDHDIDQVVEDLRARQGHLASAGAEPARRGDFVLVKVARAPEGMERLQPGNEALVEVGGGLLPSEVETALEGARAGEDRTAPADGTEGAIEVHVVDVRRKELPPLDDAFARAVSNQSTLAGLRESLRQRVATERAEAEAREYRERVMEALLAQAAIDLPDSLVQQEIDHMVDDLAKRLQSRGLSLETYLRSQDRDESRLRADLRSAAERRVRTHMLLNEVAEREGITLSEEEISAAVKNLADESREDMQKTQAWLAQGERLTALREFLRRQKALAALIAFASEGGAGGVVPDAGPQAEAPGGSAS